MAITINIYYKGKNNAAKDFANEMMSSGVVDEIRAENGNIRYDYFLPINDDDTVLLIDSWDSQNAIDNHHKSPMMLKILALRQKYDIHMTVERYVTDENGFSSNDKKYIKE